MYSLYVAGIVWKYNITYVLYKAISHGIFFKVSIFQYYYIVSKYNITYALYMASTVSKYNITYVLYMAGIVSKYNITYVLYMAISHGIFFMAYLYSFSFTLISTGIKPPHMTNYG